jgi:HSP20 family molecular chaperone IbpA
VRGQDAKATYEDGMLRIELPLVRASASRPVSIGKADDPHS